MDIEQFRKAGYQAIDRICDYYYSLQERSVTSQVEPGYLRQHVPLTAPEKGEDFQIIADDYQKIIMPGLTHWQHPSFFAYFPTACTFEGILADLYATSATNPGFNWSNSPACTELEAIVMDWAAQLLGLSPAFMNASGVGGGCLQTTASDSALVAIVAARSLYQRNNPEAKMEDLIIYTTTQTHSLGLKAGLVLGLKVRAVEVDARDQFSLRESSLRNALDEDTKQGLKPFVLVATVGTTSSGAVDDLSEIGKVAKDYPSLWIHVDAAWAGVALSCPELREMLYLKEINQYATSFCTNFHKWGLVNFDASTLWVRDRKYLTEALDVTPSFLRTKHGDAGTVIDYRNWHLGLGRRFRSLKLWFVLRSFGVEGFQKYIRKSIELNNLFVKLIEESGNLSLVTPSSLALTVFRLVPKSSAQDAPAFSTQVLNELNHIFYGRISARHDILLTQTTLNGIFCIRLAVGAARTEEKHIRSAYDLLVKEANAVLEAYSESLSARGPVQKETHTKGII
ncbi:pyridoxal phosphate-dependent transferase [Crucibulum laeve]|uniref:Pyridoxal phosphate-dependent transferase n=1 Tax=Crucibulum laeve TaxID=68775 RepID=A0A5C3MIE2_9AGAR|nr:pyridoxal phosphate-dependent transferase [Crucibulum laeve]